MSSDGAPWLSDLPDGWESSRLKHLVRIEGGGTPSKAEPRYWQGEIPWVSPKDMKGEVISSATDSISEEAVRHSATQVVPPGSVLIVVRSGILQHSIPVATTAVPVALNQDLKALIPRGRLDAEYLAGVIRGHQGSLLVAWRRTGATVDNLDVDILADTPFPVPPVAQQIEIIRYLRNRLREIDDLIARKERLIELLEEKRTALITRAVTKGLDPDVEMKDSGVEWLGEIPAHWAVRPSGSVFRERDERGYPDLPILNVSIHTGVSVRQFASDKIEQQAEDRSTYKRALAGDMAFNKMRMWQGAVGAVPVDGLVSPDYTVINSSEFLSPQYYETLFRTSYFKTEVDRHSYGMVRDRNRLYWINFKQLKIPFPPVEEQRMISDWISKVSTEINNARGEIVKAIHLLREYRSALISAAVTGKIDVREAAVHD